VTTGTRDTIDVIVQLAGASDAAIVARVARVALDVHPSEPPGRFVNAEESPTMYLVPLGPRP